jgi:tetratricopeptide (TPR) repeat protein
VGADSKKRREIAAPRGLGALLLAVGTLLAYWPALRGSFLFDDPSLLTDSPLVKAADGLRRMWFTTEAIDYWPLTNSSFWLEWRLWGSNPTGYHVTNVLLHITAGLLIWAILRRLAVPGAWLAAMLFALHPVNVQSVAWIAQRKNTLSMVFFLLSILTYLTFDRDGMPAAREDPRKARPGSRRPDRLRQGFGETAVALVKAESRPIRVWYWLSLAFFVLAMLSKGSVAILPGILLLLTWWRRQRITQRDVVRILPFLVVAIALTLVNLWFQSRMVGGVRDVTVLQRILGAAGVIWFYVAKALVPIHLVFIYPQWDVRADDLGWWLPLVAAAAFTVVLIQQRRRPVVRAMLVAWAFVCVALTPVMGFTDVYFMKYSLVADHYEYIAAIAIVASVAAGLDRLFRAGRPSTGPSGFGPSAVASALLLALAGVATWQQAHLYAGPEPLYRATLRANPGVPVVHNNLGAWLADQGRNEEAAAEFREALRLQPDLASAHSNLCEAAATLHRVDEALTECAATVRTNPARAAAHKNLGTALASAGRLREARAELETALALNPDSIQTHYELADVLRATGEPAAAVGHYRRVLRDWPDAAGAESGLANALLELGQTVEAEAAFRESIRLNPELADAHRDLADLLMQRGRADDAIQQYQEALARDPRSADTQNNLGVALARAGRPAEAAEHFRAALKLQPDLADARANLERILRK